ncbi:MAG: hypothetical protein V4699_03370 [Patescibacteria group bacterium]
MDRKISFLILFVTILGLPSFVFAEKYILNITGQPRTPEGQIDLIYSAGLATDKGTIESESRIDNEKGIFEIKNAVLDTDAEFNSVAAFAEGGCFYHSYSILRVGDHFEVNDGYDPEHKVVINTKNPNIDLGVLKEEKSNQLRIDFDTPIKLLVEDLSGNWVAENGGYSKLAGTTNSLKSNTTYKLTLTRENGKQIIREITTGSYCDGTRIIKRGSYFLTETSDNNSFHPIGFLRNIWLSILGFRIVIIIPVVIILLAVIIAPIMFLRKRGNSKNVI